MNIMRLTRLMEKVVREDIALTTGDEPSCVTSGTGSVPGLAASLTTSVFTFVDDRMGDGVNRVRVIIIDEGQVLP